MGRGKLSMEPIRNEKARMITYQKRKNGLKKKIQEFSILCGVPTCMIVYRPVMNNQPAEMEVWPKELNKFIEVVNLYREKASFSFHRIRSLNLIDFFTNRRRKVEEKLTKLRNANLEAKFPCASNVRLNKFSTDRLKQVLDIIDTQLEVTSRKTRMIKEDQALMEGSGPGSFGGCSNSQVLFQNNMELEVLTRQQTASSLKQPPMQWPPHYPPDHQAAIQGPQMLPFDYLNPVNNQPMMIMNGDDLTRFGNIFGSNIMYNQLQNPMYFNPMPAMVENPRPINFYSSTMQPLPLPLPLPLPSPYEQFPVLPTFSSQMQHASQLNPQFYGDINQSESKSIIRRLSI